jgi:hypothetical protein
MPVTLVFAFLVVRVVRGMMPSVATSVIVIPIPASTA